MNKYYGSESIRNPETETKLQQLESLETELQTMLQYSPSPEHKAKIEGLLFGIPTIAMHLKDGLSGKDLDVLSKEVANLKK